MKKALIALVALAFVAAFAMPATAAEKSEVSFGGFVSFDTWIVDTDEPMLDTDGDGAWDDGRYDDTDTLWTIDEVCSRFNATFKRENFTGFVEMRPRDNAGDMVQVRHWYAEWDFGPGYLLLGQTWVPTFSPISASVGPINSAIGGGGCSTGFGDSASWAARAPMIRLRFPFSVGQFTFALVDPAMSGFNANEQFGNENDIDYTIPQLEAALNLNFGPVSMNLIGNWLEYEEVYRNNADFSENEMDVDSWMVGTNVKFTAGPFGLALAGWLGENTSASGFLFGIPDRGELRPFIWDASGDGFHDTVADTDDWGAYITATFKLNDMVSFAAGGGLLEQDMTINNANYENEAASWYVNSTITVAEGFNIKPEIGEFMYGDSIIADEPRDQGDQLYYGIWWQMNF